MKRREQAMAEREMQVAAWEARTQTAGPAAEPEEPVASEHTMSAVTRLTRAPFNLARTMLSGKR